MPNGGFGCAYCISYTNSFCNLRKTIITNDHWTVCANVQLKLDMLDGDEDLSEGLCGFSSFPEIKGDIYAITSDEGAYAQVPWLEDGEIHVVNSMRTCVVCQKSQEKGKGIAWRGEKYFFCTYAHYLSWRNLQIQVHKVDAEVMGEDFLRYFNNFRELKIIDENTTPEQRSLALKRDARKKRIAALKKLVTWAVMVTIAIAIYKYFLG